MKIYLLFFAWNSLFIHHFAANCLSMLKETGAIAEDSRYQLWGTIGFICSMWAVFGYLTSYMQLVLGRSRCVMAFTAYAAETIEKRWWDWYLQWTKDSPSQNMAFFPDSVWNLFAHQRVCGPFQALSVKLNIRFHTGRNHRRTDLSAFVTLIRFAGNAGITCFLVVPGLML